MDRRSLLGLYDEFEKLGGPVAKVLVPAALGTGLGAGIGALAGDEGDRWKSVRKGMLIGGGVGGGVGLGGVLGAIPGRIQSAKALDDFLRSRPGSLISHDLAPTKGVKATLSEAARGGLNAFLGGALGAGALGTAGGLGGAAIERKLREKKKTAALEKIAALDLEWPELLKLAAANDEIFQLLKEAGIFERMGQFMKRKGAPAIGKGVKATGRGIATGGRKVGRGAQRGYAAVQSELGQAMAGAGRWGHHGGEIARGVPHAAMAGAVKGGSPAAAALHIAPEVAPLVTHHAKRAGGRLLERARQAVYPVPSLRPAYAI